MTISTLFSKLCICTGALFLSFTAGYAQLPANVPQTGLVGYWSFNGNASDLSGNNNHASLISAVLSADRNGEANKAYQFGDNKYISIPNSASLQNVREEVTMAAWILIDKWVITNSKTWASVMSKSEDANSAQYRMTLISTGVSVINNGSYDDYVGFDVKLNEWIHVAVTCSENKQLSFYINGDFKGSKEMKNNFGLNNSTPFDIGRDVPGTIDYFQGKIDEVAVYNRALTECEIKNLGGFPSLPDICGMVTSLTETSENTEGIKIFPNPSEVGAYNLKGVAKEANIEIRNALGEVLMLETYSLNDLNFNGFPNGIYFVRINTKNKVHTLKFQKGL